MIELHSELTVMKALQINPKQISYMSEEVLEGWIHYLQDARESEGRLIQQFVAKIV